MRAAVKATGEPDLRCQAMPANDFTVTTNPRNQPEQFVSESLGKTGYEVAPGRVGQRYIGRLIKPADSPTSNLELHLIAVGERRLVAVRRLRP